MIHQRTKELAVKCVKILAIISTELCLPLSNRVLAECLPPLPGIIAWWPGEGNADDFAGANHGTLMRGAAYGPGKIGQAFKFNSNNRSFVKVPSVALSDFTVEFWVKADSAGFLVSNEGCGAIDDWGIDLQPNGKVRVQIGNAMGPDPMFFSSSNSLPFGEFHHVAVTRDLVESNICIYLDGVLNGRFTSPHNRPVGGSEPICDVYTNQIGFGGVERIAAATAFNFSFFNGLIDEIAIYNRPLGSNEIVALYASEAGKCTPEPQIIVQPQSQLRLWGEPLALNSIARGFEPLTYQWRRNGEILADATNSLFYIQNIQMEDAGNYTVTVTNALGGTTSLPAAIIVNPAGVSIALYPGVKIEGIVGQSYKIETTTNLNDLLSWSIATNFTLTTSTQLWYDATPASFPTRYYRVLPGTPP